MNGQLCFVIFDDHRLFSAGLKAILATLGRSIKIDEITDPQRALSRQASAEHFDLVLLDMDMPGLSGVDNTRSDSQGETVSNGCPVPQPSPADD